MAMTDGMIEFAINHYIDFWKEYRNPKMKNQELYNKLFEKQPHISRRLIYFRQKDMILVLLAG